MWDDIIIGKGEKGCSAIRIFKIEGNHNISENRVSFWISNCFLDTGMTIFKDTKEGQQLSKMIESGKTLEQINKWLDLIVIKHLKPDRLKQFIDKVKKESYEQGRKAKVKEFLLVLNQ